MHEKMKTPPPLGEPSSPGRKTALFLCALLLVSAPLLFGAVDRVFQIALTTALGFGLLLAPPAVPRLGKGALSLVVLFAALLFFQEFGPERFFKATLWRRTLSDSFGIALPWTHNPEPARALDALLAAAVGGVWFGWVRDLGGPREDRIFLAWSMLWAAAIVAVVCFAMGQSSTTLIYGVRETPGWTGYGPFPNRNHTASFLAMGAVVGCGLVTRAAARKRPFTFCVGLLLLGLILVAMLWSKSRGGLMAFGFGFLLFVAIALAGAPSVRGWFAAAAGTLGVAALCLTFGSRVIGRFAPGGDVATNSRWDVWKDTVAMWRDAPLFGHGLETFPRVFPLYQTFSLEDRIILHPESSWLLWLAELGGLLVLLLAVGLVVFLARNLPQVFSRRQGFFLAAGCLGAAGVLLCHCLWDVPGHRWATAWYGLAALGLACPVRSRETEGSRALALIPFGIAFFWSLPILLGWPAWSPLSLAQLLNRAAVSTSVRLAELENALRFFPLNADLHEAAGMREAQMPGRADAAWRQFRIADRLMPDIWELPAGQAEVSERRSPGMALHFWTLAIERAGHRGDEIFAMAVRDTLNLPGAEAFWRSYVETNPQFCLSYAQYFAGAAERDYFNRWWNTRALSGRLNPYEIQTFYQNAARWATPAQFGQWMRSRASREPEDCMDWVRILDRLGADDAAWTVLARALKEPPFPGINSAASADFLRSEWETHPGNALNALTLAERLAATGKTEKSDEIILAAAARPGAPDWFLKKAAFVLARKHRYAEAVAMGARVK